MIKKIKEYIDKFKVKQEILVLKGMVAEIYKRVDWNEDKLTTEEQLKLKELMTAICKTEYILNNSKQKKS